MVASGGRRRASCLFSSTTFSISLYKDKSITYPTLSSSIQFVFADCFDRCEDKRTSLGRWHAYFYQFVYLVTVFKNLFFTRFKQDKNVQLLVPSRRLCGKKDDLDYVKRNMFGGTDPHTGWRTKPTCMLSRWLLIACRECVQIVLVATVTSGRWWWVAFRWSAVSPHVSR